MLNRLDWKLRWLTQEMLNWGGVKFGWTQAGVLRQLMLLFWICCLWGLWRVDSWPIAGIILVALGCAINCLICLILWHNIDSPGGEVKNWELGRVFRYFSIYFTFLFVFSDIGFAVFGSIPLKLHDVVNWVEHISYLLMWYVASCIKPPPKEKKEAHKLAWQLGG